MVYKNFFVVLCLFSSILHVYAAQERYLCSPQGAAVQIYDEGLDLPLLMAAERGEIDRARALIIERANVNALDGDKSRPLHMAAIAGHAPMVRFLLGQGAKINALNKDGITALHDAANRGHSAVVRVLLAYGADAKIFDSYGWTALGWASEMGHLDAMEVLLEHGVEADFGNSGWTTLMIVSQNGFPKIVHALLNRWNVNANVAQSDGWTALMSASLMGHNHVVQILLEHGAMVNAERTSEMGTTTPLKLAAFQGHKDVVRSLLENGAKFDLSSHCSGLLVERGHKDIVELLFNQGELFDANCHSFLLHFAVEYVDLLRMLLDYGAKVNVYHSGAYPLHRAAEYGCEEALRLLIERGANVNTADLNGDTSLYKALWKDRGKAIILLLLEGGADVNIANRNGETPLHCSYDNNIIQLLLDHGAEVDARDRHGQMLLHDLINFGPKGTSGSVRTLLLNGADVNASDNYSKRPLHYAIKKHYRNDGMVRLLLKRGAYMTPKEINEVRSQCYPLNAANLKAIVDDRLQLVSECLNQWCLKETGNYLPIELCRLILEVGESDFQANRLGELRKRRVSALPLSSCTIL